MRTLGIDAGATHVRYGLVSEGSLSQEQRVKSSIESPEELAKQCAEIIEKFPDIEAIGIVTPGPLDSNGVLHQPANLPGWGAVNFKNVLEKTINRPFMYDRDSVAALVGEWKQGAAQDKKNVVLLTLGTGIGGAVLVNGRILRGHHGFSGELGHVLVGPTGRKCGLGHDGCAEAWASGKARNEGVGIKQAADVIARLLLSLELTFDPEVFILSGGLLNEKEYIEPILTHINTIGLQTSVQVGKLGEWAGVVGATHLATERM